jgi:hypothetical protein
MAGKLKERVQGSLELAGSEVFPGSRKKKLLPAPGRHGGRSPADGFSLLPGPLGPRFFGSGANSIATGPVGFVSRSKFSRGFIAMRKAPKSAMLRPPAFLVEETDRAP